jgi:glycolate oxidase FAD binding subunit
VQGPASDACARQAVAALAGHGLDATVDGADEAVWDRQRAAQRSDDAVVVRVGALPGELARVLRAADRAGATVVGRAGLGLAWLTLPRAEQAADAASAVAALRADLAPRPCVVLDHPPSAAGVLDRWGPIDPGALALMHRVKARFDPAGVCAAGEPWSAA